MKLQLTALAAAISLTLSGATLADAITSNSNLDYKSIDQSQGGGYGLNNLNSTEDDRAWEGFPPERNGAFTEYQTELNSMDGSTAGINENISTIDQTATGTTGNQASVEQYGGSQNESNITQNKSSSSGDALKADVVQAGNLNRSDIDQDLSTGAVTNVYQNGVEHVSRVAQLGADRNGADVTQTGANQQSIIYQGVEDGGAADNNAWTIQSGTSNQSYIRQQWFNNSATATQTGTDGISHIKQAGHFNTASLDQTGTENSSYILQGERQVGDNNTADVSQSGEYNDSYVSQLNGDDNTAEVNQQGRYGEANVLQSGSDNEASILQAGIGDVAWVIQNGNAKMAEVNQSGSGLAGSEFNEAYIMQNGGGAHTASVTQLHNPESSWNNIATITQTGAVDASSIVTQTGSGNRASTIQY